MKYFLKKLSSIALVGFIYLFHSCPVFADGPVLDIWYGDNQNFGSIGTPQRWVNILGNVSDPVGVSSLEYSLNGGSYNSLQGGPDNARLANSGDFNVEMSIDDLLIGQNSVVIRGTNNNAEISTETVNFQYNSSYWPILHDLDWSTVSDIQDAVQVVDGKWVKDGNAIRPVETGYDRLVAIGDRFWNNYEISVEVTVNWVDPDATRPGVGVLMRWDGHHNWNGSQPNVGWWPMGALAWMRYNTSEGDRFTIVGNEGTQEAVDRTGLQLATGITYNYKVRVETPVPGEGSWYRLKVWEKGQNEPSDWALEDQEEVTDPQNGSMLLVAHHADASFGNLSITPLDSGSPSDPPVISDLIVSASDTYATISWLTDKPSYSEIEYGTDISYGSVVSDAALNIAHSITISELDPDTQYHFEAISTDFLDQFSSSGDQTFITSPPVPLVQSDEFNSSSLDPIWTTVDPVGDGQVSLNGGQLVIDVPAGTSHDVWSSGNNSVRVVQGTADEDFQVDVKFDSAPSLRYQLQGVLVSQDDDNFLRFDFYHDGNRLNVFAASFVDGSPSVLDNTAITSGTPLYLRVVRSGDTWTLSYSYDGANWTVTSTSTRALTVSDISVFAGNSGPSPAFTALVDYFQVNAMPSEDTQPPGISNVQVLADGSTASVTWQTSEPANTQLDYGLTTGYELGQVGGAELVTEHSVNLSGLDIEATYHFQISATDAAANTATSADMSFSTEVAQAPVISNINVLTTDTRATITWNTDQASDSVIEYGIDNTYGSTASDAGLVTSHSIVLDGLNAETNYHFQVSSTTAGALSSSSGDQSFTTSAASTLQSDGFDAGTLNPIWTTVDPVGDGLVSLNGSQLVIDVPAGASHDVWNSGNDSVRVVQGTADEDFQVDVKFDSVPSLKYQLQGVLVSQDDDNFLRFDFYHDGRRLNIFAASFVNGSPSVLNNTRITSGTPLYLRVVRSGDTWTLSYSYDGANWTVTSTSTRALTVSDISVFAGNSGPSPAFTALVDYFQVNAMPSEDTQPPGISNVQVLADGSTASVTWQTSEPANTQLDYGLTTGYELGQVGGAELVTEHSVNLSGLDIEATYHFQISATDAAANTATSADMSFSTEAAQAPVISNINVLTTDTRATITWDTDQASDSVIEYGVDNAYGSTASDAGLVTSHSIVLNGLNAETNYHFQVSSTTAGALSSSSGDQSFTTSAASTLQSDGFDAGTLNPIWTTVDPVGDGLVSLNGSQLVIDVPAGASHDVWNSGNDSVRVVQGTADEDFQVDVKFDSVPSLKYQLQGVLVSQDDDNFLRFDFYHDGRRLNIFAASFVNGSPSVLNNTRITSGTPLYLRVVRSGDTWTLSYSYDGANWTVTSTSTRALTVSDISVFAGNSGPSPAFTALVDYFQVNAMPSEDTQPPGISNVQVLADGSTASVTWQTSEPANTQLDYGLTTGYELGQVGGVELVTEHSVNLSGLDIGATYHFQISATDAAANTATSADMSFSTEAAQAPVISNINVLTTDTRATITWDTDQASDSVIEYGVDNAYGSTASDAGLVTSHSIVLNGLNAETNYHFQVSSTTAGALSSSSGDQSFTTSAASTLQSDGFDAGTLNPIWTTVDPVGDGLVSLNGSQLVIDVPAGASHDVWNSGNDSVRVVQGTADEDFQVDVKFDSVPSLKYQLQGVLVSQDDGNFLRFDFYHNGRRLNIFAASFVNGSPSVLNNTALASSGPLYLRVVRSGDTWTLSYSYDGANWTVTSTSTRALTVSDISVFAGNSGPSPAFTALVDYFQISN